MWKTSNEKPCNLVTNKTTERYLTNQQKGIDAEVGLSFQPTSGINPNTEPQNLCHYIIRGGYTPKQYNLSNVDDPQYGLNPNNIIIRDYKWKLNILNQSPIT